MFKRFNTRFTRYKTKRERDCALSPSAGMFNVTNIRLTDHSKHNTIVLLPTSTHTYPHTHTVCSPPRETRLTCSRTHLHVALLSQESNPRCPSWTVTAAPIHTVRNVRRGKMLYEKHLPWRRGDVGIFVLFSCIETAVEEDNDKILRYR